MEKKRTSKNFKEFAEHTAAAFDKAELVTAYPLGGGRLEDNPALMVEVWTDEALPMIEKRDFCTDCWNYGWNNTKGRIASFVIEESEAEDISFADFIWDNLIDWAGVVVKVEHKGRKFERFREFAGHIAECFANAKFVTAYPVYNRFDNEGVPERVRFDVWTSEAAATLREKMFSAFDGWTFSPGRITSFDLTESPDGSGRNTAFFSELGSFLPAVSWRDAVVAL